VPRTARCSSNVKTTGVAKDVDSLPKEEQINYYGFSYGTYLGQVLRHAFH
jgi:hypothetical protein